MPECRPNPCQLPNYVTFREQCYPLDKEGPCMFPELGNVVGVNETTLKVMCTKDSQILAVIDRVGEENCTLPEKPVELPVGPAPQNVTVYHEYNKCLVGGRRWTAAKCPEQDISYKHKNNNENYNNNNDGSYQSTQLELNKTIHSIFNIPPA